MNPQNKWKQERMEGKRKRMNGVIEAAERVFSKKGFEKATMQEIAEEANIGVATVFRYFPKKDKIIVAVVVNILERYLKYFESVRHMEGTCLQKIEEILDFFISDIKSESLERTQLLEAFESYAAVSDEGIKRFEDYNKIRKEIAATLSSLIEESVNDGSIRSDIQVKEVLASITNAFGLFSRKLSLFKQIPSLEHDVSSEDQLCIIKQIFLDYISIKE